MGARVHERALMFSGLEVMASIGFHAHEKTARQRVRIDIKLVLDAAGEPVRDDVAECLDYDVVRQGIMALATAQHYNLQEVLARRLADYVLDFDEVIAAEITTAKPDAYPDCAAVSYHLAVRRDAPS